MKINNKFALEDLVYLITDEEQKKRMVTEIKVRETGLVYELTCGVDASDHNEYEIAAATPLS